MKLSAKELRARYVALAGVDPFPKSATKATIAEAIKRLERARATGAAFAKLARRA